MRVNFNIMLNSAIKSDAFIPYKKSGFYKMKNLKKRKVLRFCLSLLPQKCAFFFNFQFFFQIFLMRVNFNIMLSSAIKSDAFIPYKKSGFYKMKNLKKRKILRFCLSLLPQKCALQSSAPKYLKNCYRTRSILSLIVFIWKSIIKIRFMIPIMH